MQQLIRHIDACNNAVLPGRHVPLRVAGAQVGWMDPAIVEPAARLGGVRTEAGLSIEPAQLQPVARALADAGLLRWRDEAFDVRARPDGPALAQLDRGALPRFGVEAVGVHVNGLVGDRLWVARRAADKLLDPGKLDHLVAGGVAAGHGVADTLIKEAGEEAGLDPALARTARHVGTVRYAMARDEGLRRDTLHCFDLELPEDFVPVPRDGEVAAFELWPLTDVFTAVSGTDQFKFNVNLVLIDLFLRRGMVTGDAAAVLRRRLG